MTGQVGMAFAGAKEQKGDRMSALAEIAAEEACSMGGARGEMQAKR